MILVTTETVPGRTISGCLGLAVAERVVAPSAAQSFTFTTDRLIEVRQALLFEAREAVLQRLVDIAHELGGHAVVAIRLDYEQLESTMQLVLATATGTVVALDP